MASFTNVTVTEADAYRAQVGHMEEMLQRAFTSGEAHGTSGAGRPQVFEGVGAPWPELHVAPRLFSPDTVTVGASETDEIRLVQYAQGVARMFVNVFTAHSVTNSVNIANIVRGADINATISAIRAEMVNVVTAWNANTSALQNNPTVSNPNFPSMPTPPAIA